MKRTVQQRRDWLAALSTRELVIYLMELWQVSLAQPELSAEVDEACQVLRTELRRRAEAVPVAS